MTRNEGMTDRVLRGVVGLVVLALALFGAIGSPALFWLALIVGAVMLGTAAIGFCPAYRLLGIKTCKDC